MTGTAHGATGAGSGFNGFFRPPFAAAINHVINSTSWASERLKPHAGKTVRFDVAPVAVTLAILDTGYVENSSASAAFDTRIALTPGTALRMLATGSDALQDVQVEGDTALARDILHLAQNLRWDVEEDLSRAVGDIIAHRLVRFSHDIRHWHSAGADNLARSAAIYWTDERPLIATRHDIERHLREIDVLRDYVARVEKRLDHLLHGQAACLQTPNAEVAMDAAARGRSP